MRTSDLRLSRKRSEFVRGLWFVLICTVVGTSIAFSFWWIGHSLTHRRDKTVSPVTPASTTVELTSPAASETVIAASHPITPRGVHDLRELLALIQSDSAVARHYRDQGFDLGCAHMDTLNANVWARVSYRTAGGFAFTERPVLILQGEDVIADCHGHLIRSACGNLIAIAEKSPEQVPTEVIAEVVPFEDTIPIGLTPAPIPQTETPDTPVQVGPPIIVPADTPVSPDIPILCCIVGGPGSPITPVATPENSILSMVVAGCALVFTLRISKSRGQKSVRNYQIQSETPKSKV
jgi:hypothetical protein